MFPKELTKHLKDMVNGFGTVLETIKAACPLLLPTIIGKIPAMSSEPVVQMGNLLAGKDNYTAPLLLLQPLSAPVHRVTSAQAKRFQGGSNVARANTLCVVTDH